MSSDYMGGGFSHLIYVKLIRIRILESKIPPEYVACLIYKVSVRLASA